MTTTIVGAAVVMLAWFGTPAAGIEPPKTTGDDRCMQCHGQPHIGELDPAERLSMVGTWLGVDPAPDLPAGHATPELTGEEPATRPGLFVAPGSMGRVTHTDVSCVECHEDANMLPHAPRLELATCATACHQQAVADYDGGAHAEARSHRDERAPTCASCHGGHEILPIGARQSRQHRLNSIFLCADCHEAHESMTPSGFEPGLHIAAYLESEHGKAVAESGLVAAPTCVDCHSAHAVHAVSDPQSPVHRDRIPETCGECHVGILDIYEASIHGRLHDDHNGDAPVCTDCHTSHEIVPSDRVAFKLKSDERCGHCHEDRLHRYRETFHGKALVLGMPGVASCYDCHGHHDIVPISDPSSRLAGDRKLETCQKCHPDAGPKFAGYIAHADHYDREGYPVLFWTFVFMTALVIGTFAFFGAHTLLWFARSSALYIHDREGFREAKAKAAKDDETFVRFKPFDRFLHILVMLSFLLLVATGMPLKFYETGWAQHMVRYVGGLEAAAQLHRFGAIITFLYFVLHIGSLVRRAIDGRSQFRDPDTGRYSVRRVLGVAFGPDMPIPNLQDLRDFWAHQKWFIGRGPRPQFDRWTYWEKFDYFAVFWGVAIIGLSGLVMWFPEATTRFLPGWVINVALIVHSDEALLAAGFIFTFHFFNVHFRVEKFPIDSVIFSGRISRTEMLHERKRWYDRLAATGRLDQTRVRDEWFQWKNVIHPLGYLAFGIGLVLLVLILYAMGLRLTGVGT